MGVRLPAEKTLGIFSPCSGASFVRRGKRKEDTSSEIKLGDVRRSAAVLIESVIPKIRACISAAREMG